MKWEAEGTRSLTGLVNTRRCLESLYVAFVYTLS